jgi:carboxymethylenebutenolidase
MAHVQTEFVKLKVSDGTEMRAYVSKPAGLNPAVGLLVFPEVFGVNHHMRAVTDRFAEHGYLSLCPEIFHRTAPPGFESPYDQYPAEHTQALTDAGLDADAKASFDWIQSQGAKNIGAVGYCMGGRVAYSANAFLPLKGAVSYYGTRMLKLENPDLPKNQRGPLLFHWGGLDKSSTSEQLLALTGALKTAGKNFINVEYSRADHGFSCDERASYNAEAAEQAWVLTIAFFKLHLSKA